VFYFGLNSILWLKGYPRRLSNKECIAKFKYERENQWLWIIKRASWHQCLRQIDSGNNWLRTFSNQCNTYYLPLLKWLNELKATILYQLISWSLFYMFQQPIPWKWLALESFESHIFSYKTDVWAYGVTLWEIFSLGDNPYGDIPCTPEFVIKLQRGNRLSRPQLASKEM